ncbi:hypothetical protein QTP70_030364 [Hemibagrus guttatus]|uniref:Sulfotransferase n=1 Tax=Hemibagrus guttatus TaxID=175788 RepID=A0AAE0Q168_9TELE|nr:hypothetical protein QTP70_030364 [Hemibagrus guttatus]
MLSVDDDDDDDEDEDEDEDDDDEMMMMMYEKQKVYQAATVVPLCKTLNHQLLSSERYVSENRCLHEYRCVSEDRLWCVLDTGGDWLCSDSMIGLMPRTLDSQITMEKTPSYFVTHEAPRRIATMSQDTKLIVVVRNPVTRAISDYTQTLSKKPDIPSFEELAFKNRSQGLVDTSWNAIRIGMYILHLENWLQYFRLSQIHFVSGERLITDPAGELGRVQDFLGLKRIITDKHFYFNRTKGFPCLKKPESSSTPRCLGKSKGRTHVQIDQEVIEQLRDFYRPFNVKFYEMVGHDFRWD